MSIAIRTLFVAALLCVGPASLANEEPFAYPTYKPSSRSPEAVDIRTNAYGASRDAPNALRIGEVAPDFTAPRAGGGKVALVDARAEGPVALIFYRGHW